MRLLLSAALAVFLLFGSSPAQAAPRCDTRGNVLQILSGKYQESPVAIGVTNNGGLVEVLTTADGGTWSIIVTTPRGWSCLVASGVGWKSIAQAAAGEAS